MNTLNNNIDRNIDRNITRSKLCKRVQWLVNLGGTVEMIAVIIEYFCKTKQNIVLNINKPSNAIYKSSLVYTSSNGISGHWVYYNSKGVVYNSYDLDHQRPGSDQFCQSYSILYMLGDNNDEFKKRFTDKLSSGRDNYANNIYVVVDFWRLMFKYSKLLSNWMIFEVKLINEQVLLNNENTYITKNTSKIDKKRIMRLLSDIYNYAEQIVQYA